MRISLILAKNNPVYEGLGIKFFEHFIHVSAAIRKGHFRQYDMWNQKDGFFYSFLIYPNGQIDEIPIRSLVGIVPFFAVDVWEEKELKAFPEFYTACQWMLEKKPELTDKCIQRIESPSGPKYFFGLLSKDEMPRFLNYLWDPEEFRSEFGLRSLSKYHESHPICIQNLTFSYEPRESYEKIKGGNSNWRGPIWFPVNFLLIQTLLCLDKVFHDKIQIQVKQEPKITLEQMAQGFAERLLNLFKKNEQGFRPFYGEVKKFQHDPNFNNYFLFHEYFDGDTGCGLGASHQTGWTSLIANLIEYLRSEK